MHRTFTPKKAIANWWPSRYERNEVVAMMKYCEKEKLIIKEIKVERWSWYVTYRSGEG